MSSASPPSSRIRMATAAVVIAALAAAVAVGAGMWTQRADHGWRGAYYPERDFGGEPVLRRDPQIAFQWMFDPAVPALPPDGFTIRWDTCLHLDEAREIEARLGSDDGTRLLVNGEKKLDNWRPQAFHWTTGTIHLPAGRHHLVVEYFEGTGKAEVAAHFQLPGLEPRELPLPWLHLPEGAPGDDAPCD